MSEISSKLYIGIDPGANGAVALFQGQLISIFDIPTVQLKKNRKLRTRIDCVAFFSLLAGVVSNSDAPCVALIEDVGGLPGQGGSQSFNFGAICGAIEMACVAAGAEVVKVSPAKWKARARLIGKEKTASRDLASTLWPGFARQFARVKDDGRAEAALIAEFGRD